MRILAVRLIGRSLSRALVQPGASYAGRVFIFECRISLPFLLSVCQLCSSRIGQTLVLGLVPLVLAWDPPVIICRALARGRC